MKCKTLEMRDIELVVPQQELDDAEYHLSKSVSFDHSERTVYTWTADLGNGFECDIKVVDALDATAGDYYNGGGPWCEAVLFHNGSEVYCSEVSDSVRGEWYFEDGDEKWCIVVVGSDEVQEALS